MAAGENPAEREARRRHERRTYGYTRDDFTVAQHGKSVRFSVRTSADPDTPDTSTGEPDIDVDAGVDADTPAAPPAGEPAPGKG